MTTERNSSKFDVLLDGGYFSDLVFTGLPEFPRLGHEVYARKFTLAPGGAYNTAVALHRLRLSVAWPCRFGMDPFSQFVNDSALREGLDGSFFETNAHSSLHITAAFSFEKERAFLSYSDPQEHLPLLKLLKRTRPDWLCLTRLSFGSEYEALLRAAHNLGTKIFMDCQAHHQRISDPQIQAALRNVDVFAPNEEEACQLTGEAEAGKAAQVLSAYAPLVIVKRGSQGCLCLRQENETLNVPGIRVQAVDTTGAGDNFNCGFLCGCIRGFSLLDSLRMGNICGGLSTQGSGGTATSPTFNQVKHFLDKY
jgi:sugar/nucleoside kinase (ribokinase family)